MKRTPLKRKTPLRAKKPWKRNTVWQARQEHEARYGKITEDLPIPKRLRSRRKNKPIATDEH